MLLTFRLGLVWFVLEKGLVWYLVWYLVLRRAQIDLRWPKEWRGGVGNLDGSQPDYTYCPSTTQGTNLDTLEIQSVEKIRFS